LKNKTYEERLKHMKLPSLSYCHLRGDLIEVYKYTHGIYKIPNKLLELETRNNTRGHAYKLKKLRCNTTLRQHFFTSRVTDSWNCLPNAVVEAQSLNSFKNRLDAVLGNYMYCIDVPPTALDLIKRSVD
jgi:hypothetical protein